MNFALPAIAILVLVLPGILFYYFLRGGHSWANPVRLRSVSDEAVWSVFFALIIQLIGIWILPIFGRKLDTHSLLVVLSGGIKPEANATLPKVTDNLKCILLYLVFSNAGSVILGIAAHKFIKKHKWDLKRPIFRFNNQWNYVLDGGIRAIDILEENTKAEIRLKKKEVYKEINLLDPVHFVAVRAIIEEPGRLVEYFGRLVSYDYDNQNEINHIILKGSSYCILHQSSEGGKNEPSKGAIDVVAPGNREVSHREVYDDKLRILNESHYVDLKHSNIRSIGVKYECMGKTQKRQKTPQTPKSGSIDYMEDESRKLKETTSRLMLALKELREKMPAS